MPRSLLDKISNLYTEEVESVCVRLLYFFNTINTYFIFAGIVSFVIVFPGEVHVARWMLALMIVVLISKLADFYPYFVIGATPALLFLGVWLRVEPTLVLSLLLANLAVFCTIQVLFMGIPDS